MVDKPPNETVDFEDCSCHGEGDLTNRVICFKDNCDERFPPHNRHIRHCAVHSCPDKECVCNNLTGDMPEWDMPGIMDTYLRECRKYFLKRMDENDGNTQTANHSNHFQI